MCSTENLELSPGSWAFEAVSAVQSHRALPDSLSEGTALLWVQELVYVCSVITRHRTVSSALEQEKLFCCFVSYRYCFSLSQDTEIRWCLVYDFGGLPRSQYSTHTSSWSTNRPPGADSQNSSPPQSISQDPQLCLWGSSCTFLGKSVWLTFLKIEWPFAFQITRDQIQGSLTQVPTSPIVPCVTFPTVTDLSESRYLSLRVLFQGNLT